MEKITHFLISQIEKKNLSIVDSLLNWRAGGVSFEFALIIAVIHTVAVAFLVYKKNALQ